MKVTYKVTTAIAAAALMAASFAPAAFADVIVSGNGNGSSNDVSVSKATVSSMSQSNSTDVTNVVTASGNTGRNHTSFNTGSTASVTTGGVINTVGTTVGGSMNTATMPTPCGCGGLNDIIVSGNGNGSSNSVDWSSLNVSSFSQSNSTGVLNLITAHGNTGRNHASFNTSGTHTINTGGVTNTVYTTVGGSSNSMW